MAVKSLLDINIWLDVATRPLLFPESVTYFRHLCELSIPGFPLCGYTTFFYLASRSIGQKAVMEFLQKLESQGVDYVRLEHKDLILAKSMGFKDEEDACIAACGARNGYNLVVTRNKKDFKKSPIAVRSPNELIP
jgi:hypothetical protein